MMFIRLTGRHLLKIPSSIIIIIIIIIICRFIHIHPLSTRTVFNFSRTWPLCLSNFDFTVILFILVIPSCTFLRLLGLNRTSLCRTHWLVVTEAQTTTYCSRSRIFRDWYIRRHLTTSPSSAFAKPTTFAFSFSSTSTSFAFALFFSAQQPAVRHEVIC